MNKIFLAVSLFWFLVSCSAYQQGNDHPDSNTRTSEYPRETVVMTATNISAETPIYALTPTFVPTLTPRPTLSSQDAQVAVLKLISNNGGCNLPCWWGLTPGKTTWQEARNFLEILSPQIISLRDNVYGLTYKNLPKDISGGVIGATISTSNDVIQTISTDIYYPLAEIMQKNGKPTEIWIFADKETINPEIPFTLALFYADQGILAIYQGTSLREESPEICPNRIGGDQVSWFLWNPSLAFSFADAGRNALLFQNTPSERPFLQINDVTNMDISMFYDKYIHPENGTSCFEMLNK